MSCAIAVMAKVPRPGHSKTRLVPPLSFEAAATLSAAFLRDTTANLARAACAAPIVPYAAYAPAGLETVLGPHLEPGTGLLLADGAIEAPEGVRGFGRCLLHAIRDLLAAGHESACVLNADGPTLPTGHLMEAAAILSRPGDRAVLGEAADGGYYLLGLKRAHVGMFEDIAWSTEVVAAQTAERARRLGLDLERLPPWYDVDDAASLACLLAEFRGEAPAGYAASATRACVAQLRLGAFAAAGAA